MAISTDKVIDYFGTQDLVLESSTTTLASSAFATTADVINWTNDDNAPEATFTFLGVFSSLNETGGALNLYARRSAAG
jgi:hypothetical protein